ncbi:MAG: DUF4911 domain-containing protein [Nitrospinaceae bacterium]|nr:MAG: DUF4911 domain-containing protein [Nitrospinaceae bacterium]
MMHDDTVQIRIEIPKEEIAYLVSLFEGYDNLAVVRTLDNKRGLIELMVAPDYLDDTRRLLEALKDEIPLRLLA